MLGGMLSVFIVLIRYFTIKDTASKYNTTETNKSNVSYSNEYTDRKTEVSSNQMLDK